MGMEAVNAGYAAKGEGRIKIMLKMEFTCALYSLGSSAELMIAGRKSQ